MQDRDKVEFYMNRYKPFRDAVSRWLLLNNKSIKQVSFNELCDDVPVNNGKRSFGKAIQISRLVADCLGLDHDQVHSYLTPTSHHIVLLYAKDNKIEEVRLEHFAGVTYVGWKQILELADDLDKIV